VAQSTDVKDELVAIRFLGAGSRHRICELRGLLEQQHDCGRNSGHDRVELRGVVDSQSLLFGQPLSALLDDRKERIEGIE
jgi:hypothetical protein